VESGHSFYTAAIQYLGGCELETTINRSHLRPNLSCSSYALIKSKSGTMSVYLNETKEHVKKIRELSE